MPGGVGRDLALAASEAEGGDDRRVEGASSGFGTPGDRRALLADSDVDAADLADGVAGLPVGLLVDDRVDGDRGLAGLPVADDQLPLAPADRGHRVDGLDASLQRLLHRLPLHHGRRLGLEQPELGVLDRALAVQRLAQRPDHAAEEAVADRHGQHLAGALDLLALLDLVELAEDDHADLAHVQVERQAPDAVLELEQLVGHGGGQALDPRDAVAALDDGAYLFPFGTVWLVFLDEVRQRVPDLVRPDRQLSHGPLCLSVRGLPASRSAAADSFACRSARQLSPDGGQPAGRGRVYELIPDLDGNTAYDRGVYHDVQVHLVPAVVAPALRRAAAALGRCVSSTRRTDHCDQLPPAPRRRCWRTCPGPRAAHGRAGASPSARSAAGHRGHLAARAH